MAANILKLQDQLKGLPDNALVKYAKNPSGEVPQYLVLGELQRRKNMRDEYQKSQSQAPQSTVAEDLAGGIASVGPQQAPAQEAPPEETFTAAEGGLAALPIPDDMFTEEYADGGIIAFEDGGEVQKFAGKGPSLVTKDKATRLLELRAIIESPATSMSEKASASKELQMLVAPEVSARGGARTPSGLAAAVPEFLQKKQGEFESLPKPYGYKEEVVPDFDTMNKVLGELPSGPAPIAGTKKVAPAATGITTPSLGGKVAPYEVTPFTPEEIPTYEAQVALGEARKALGDSKEDFMERRKREMESAGIKDVYQKQLEELRAEKEKTKGERKDAGWMAALEAGLAITAGSSPFALQNVGVGALKGVNSYKDALKEIKQTERDIRKESAALERDQQNLLENRYGRDQAAYESALNRVEARTDRLSELNAKNTIINNSAKEYVAKSTTEASKFAAGETEANRRAQAQVDAHLKAAQIGADATTRAALLRYISGQSLDVKDLSTIYKNMTPVYQEYVAGLPKGKQPVPFQTWLSNTFPQLGGGGRPAATGSLIPGKDGTLLYTEESE